MRLNRKEAMGREQEALRTEIIEAAKQRFMSFGYGKTTMGEIGGDCGISPAHLYNFFAGKLDLAVAIAEQAGLEQRQALSGILDPEKPADEILPRYFRAELDLHAGRVTGNQGLPGLLELVKRKRPMIYAGLHRRLLKDLSLYLNARIGAGDVKEGDPFHLAESLHLATYAFRQPSFPVDRSLEDLRLSLTELVKLLLSGLKK